MGALKKSWMLVHSRQDVLGRKMSWQVRNVSEVMLGHLGFKD